MRYAELVFLALLVIYHVFVLVPRYRRPFPANYLIFAAGMALAWNLGLEGLRWQTLPPTVLMLVDLVVLFPTFATLRGQLPRKSLGASLLSGLRTLVASVAFLLAVGCTLLAVAFPLPRVELTGGLHPAYRVVRFPAAERPALEVRLWYPASGDLKSRQRPIAEPESWQRIRAEGGLPVFWQSYLEHLPSSLIKGGKVASPGTKYPVIYVALPRGGDPADFGYLFEDLASRGFVVAAGVPLAADRAPVTFSWSMALKDVELPFVQPSLWLEPEATISRSEPPTDSRGVAALQQAVRQLDAEPGDVLFSSVDWARQGLWVWGFGTPMAAAEQRALGLKGTLHLGSKPPAGHVATQPELWIGELAELKAQANQWLLAAPHLVRSDLSDAAYLKPFLAFFNLKTQADAGFHGAIRQYQAAFFQYSLWNAGVGTTFRQTVPEVPGLTLVGR